VKQLAAAIAKVDSPAKSGSLSNWASNQNAQARLAKLLAAWTDAPIPPVQLASKPGATAHLFVVARCNTYFAGYARAAGANART
jgi:hypothetical protein